jgi:hypothetical protein
VAPRRTKAARRAASAPPVPPHEIREAAEQFARDIRERLLHASGDAGLALCELLLTDAACPRQDKDGRTTGPAVGSCELPPSAWQVLVRLMEEWFNRGERGSQDHNGLAGLRRRVQSAERTAMNRQSKRPPTRETLERGAEIIRLKGDEKKTWPQVVSALEKQHPTWPQVLAYRRGGRRPEAYARLLAWARQVRRRCRKRQTNT